MSRSSTQFTRCVITAFSWAAKAKRGLRRGPEAVAKPKNIRLVDRIPGQSCLRARECREAAAVVAFRNVRAAYRLGPVLSAVDPSVRSLLRPAHSRGH